MAAREPVLPAPEYIDSASGCLARLFWMMAGNIALFHLATGIFTKSPKSISWLDLGYWLVVASLGPSARTSFPSSRYLTGSNP